MPVTRSNAIEDSDVEQFDHWSLRDDDGRKELTRTMRAHGVDPTDKASFVAMFEVDALHLFNGSLETAKRRVIDFALTREINTIDALEFPTAAHSEAKAIAWTNLLTPGGTQINITAREGASAGSVVATVLALTGAIRTLEGLGFTTRKGR